MPSDILTYMIHTLAGLKPRPSDVPSDILTYMIHTLAGLKPRPLSEGTSEGLGLRPAKVCII
jgi:hypothetical protein